MPQGLVHFCTIRGPRLHQSWSVSAPIGGLLSHQRRGLAEHESQASRHAVAPEEIWCAAPSARGSYGAADRNRPAKAQDQTAARCHAAWVGIYFINPIRASASKPPTRTLRRFQPGALVPIFLRLHIGGR